MSTDLAAARRRQALQRARTEAAARKRQSVLDTLQHLAGNGTRVTFEMVARHAGVSRQFLYGDTALRAAVEEARRSAPTVPRQDAPTGDGDALRTDLLLAREEIKRLRTENAKLKTKLVERAARAQLESEDTAARELTIRNAELVREAAALQRQLATAQEDLAACRETNRELMAQLNRRRP
ncbi:DUF6262 family protein [Streptomyces sp. NPDC046900]|uniref:DUF6262 family protein n=1 Tax=Streptomyces sp. NPDC046900 TaxID=3155473 RepID=UPI00340E39A0